MITRVQDEKNGQRQRDIKWYGLDTETIEGAPATLERVDNIEGSNSFPLGMLGIGYRVTDDLKDKLEKHRAQKEWLRTPSRKVFNTARVSS